MIPGDIGEMPLCIGLKNADGIVEIILISAERLPDLDQTDFHFLLLAQAFMIRSNFFSQDALQDVQ
mgnify:CR=1 FL=1